MSKYIEKYGNKHTIIIKINVIMKRLKIKNYQEKML